MTVTQKISNPFPIFTDLTGEPLENGKLYIGEVNLDPVNNPIVVYYDEALTLTATQPIRTHSGYPYYQGSPANLYIEEDDYSITVKTNNNIQVFTSLSAEGIFDLRTEFDEFVAALASTDGAGLIGFSHAETYVDETVGEKLKRIPAVTDAPYNAGSTSNDTAAFAAIAAQYLEFYVPEGTFNVDLIELDREGHTMHTAGMATVIQQRSGTAAGTRLINISASKVTLGTCRVKGNISTDTGEQHHGVYVNSTTQDISDITIGDIYGENLRGDVLYLGGSSGYKVTGVRHGRITGRNILRNVESIVDGVSEVDGSAVITEDSTGYATLDIEPDNDASHDIRIGLVKGAVLQVAPPNSADAAYNIDIGVVDLDPAFATNSTPTYGGYDVSDAVRLRNIAGLHIGILRMRNHVGLGIDYIYNLGELRGKNITIGTLVTSNLGGSESTYNAVINAVDIANMTIGRADCDLISGSKSIAYGSSSARSQVNINSVTCNGRVARYISDSTFSNLTLTTAVGAVAFESCDNCKVTGGEIVTPTLVDYSTKMTFENIDATCTTYFGTNATGCTAIACTFGGSFIPYRSQPVTVASLPAASAALAGTRSAVTDANATLTAGIGAAVAGGGANNVPVYCDGANWRIG